MKEKGLFAGLALALAGVMAASLAACSLGGQTGETPDIVAGSDARQELSAEGTQPTREYSLYLEAVAGGYEGTFVDFLKEIGYTGQDDTVGVNAAVNSVVSIVCGFTESATSERPPYQTTQQQVYSAGAGVIYSLDKAEGDAYIVTNYHVVYDASSVGTETVSHVSDDIAVSLYGSSETIEASYVGGAMAYDIAVLRVEDSETLKNSSAMQVSVADSDSIAVGENVYAVGNPEGEGISVTGGIVSVTAEYINVCAADETTMLSLLEIRTDAAINHGNSGGGLFNAEGELIGIVNARNEEDGVEAFGYAIPSNLALAVARSVIDNAAAGSADRGATRATLGVNVQIERSDSRYDEATCKTYIEETVVARSVSGVGESMGLDVNDTFLSAKITAADGTVVREIAVTRMHMITTLLFDVRVGDTLTFTVSRDGQETECSYTFSSASEFTLYD